MRQVFLFTLIAALFSCIAPKKELDNTFYAFNNSIRLPNAPESMTEHAEILKSLGFDGLGGHTTDEYFARRASLDKVGLKMP